MRILFMGTPDFAVASLKRLVKDGHNVCGVFTQPDKPKNRGHKMAFSPVKEYALTVGLPVYQPVKMRDGEALCIVQELAPELIVVAAYGKILPEDILNTPPYGSINVHSSILPKYRGAAPINWAILNGESVTGVTIMYMAKELDAGDIILCRETAIDPDEDAQTLTTRLAELGAVPSSGAAEKRYRRPDASGPQCLHLCPHAGSEPVAHGLHQKCPAAPRSGAGTDPLALRVHGTGRQKCEGLPHRHRRRDDAGCGEDRRGR